MIPLNAFDVPKSFMVKPRKASEQKNMVNGDWIVEQENMRLIKMMEVELFFLGKHADLSTEDFNLRNLWR